MPQTLSNPLRAEEDVPSIVIREARVDDVPTIARLINDSAEFGLMLPRSLANLYENIRNFQVAEVEARIAAHWPWDTRQAPADSQEYGSEGKPRIVGVCALTVVWANLGELASLAVAPDQRGRGLGKRLANACLDQARALGIRKVMTLTYEERFFEKIGFHVMDRTNLPHKVWSECVRCPKNEACDEIAMMRIFEDIPDQHAPEPPVSGTYDVPVVLTQTAASPAHSD